VSQKESRMQREQEDRKKERMEITEKMRCAMLFILKAEMLANRLEKLANHSEMLANQTEEITGMISELEANRDEKFTQEELRNLWLDRNLNMTLFASQFGELIINILDFKLILESNQLNNLIYRIGCYFGNFRDEEFRSMLEDLRKFYGVELDEIMQIKNQAPIGLIVVLITSGVIIGIDTACYFLIETMPIEAAIALWSVFGVIALACIAGLVHEYISNLEQNEQELVSKVNKEAVSQERLQEEFDEERVDANGKETQEKKEMI